MPTQPAHIELDADFPYQDYILIGGERSPGKATIRGAVSERGWDVRKGYALTGATVVPTGDEPVRFEVLIEIWDSADIPAWYAFAAKWFDPSVKLINGSPRALGIGHPILSAPPIRVTSAVVESCTQLEQDDLDLWSCLIKFLQYRRPKPLLLGGEPVTIDAASTPAPTAEDMADADIQQKLAQFQNLAEPAAAWGGTPLE